MKLKTVLIGAAMTALGACSGPAGNNDEAANAANAVMPGNAVDANAAISAPAPAPTLDPKSPAAAKAVVEAYGAMAQTGSFPDAAKYWTNATAAAQFSASLEDYPKVRLTAGTPTDEEGAMGSIFIAVPLTLDLTLRSGSPYQMTCKATLRRVNDVPGSSTEQRRWHIETINC